MKAKVKEEEVSCIRFEAMAYPLEDAELATSISSFFYFLLVPLAKRSPHTTQVITPFITLMTNPKFAITTNPNICDQTLLVKLLQGQTHHLLFMLGHSCQWLEPNWWGWPN